MLIIDNSIVTLANYYVISKYTAQEDITAEQLANKVIEAVKALELSSKTQSNKHATVLVMDKGRAWRKALSPSYKNGRVGNEKYMEIRPETEERLAGAFLTFGIEGLEADDLAYILTSHYAIARLVSNDGDFEAMVRGHGHSWLKYSDRKEYRLPNDHSIAIDIAVKANVKKAFLGCPGDNVPPVYNESQFQRFSACIKEIDTETKEHFLRTGIVDDVLNCICVYNNLPSSAYNYLFDNYLLTGYSEVIYNMFCPAPYAQAKQWMLDNKENLSGLKEIRYF